MSTVILYNLRCDGPDCQATFQPAGAGSGVGVHLLHAAWEGGWTSTDAELDYCPRCSSERAKAATP